MSYATNLGYSWLRTSKTFFTGRNLLKATWYRLQKCIMSTTCRIDLAKAPMLQFSSQSPNTKT